MTALSKKEMLAFRSMKKLCLITLATSCIMSFRSGLSNLQYKAPWVFENYALKRGFFTIFLTHLALLFEKFVFIVFSMYSYIEGRRVRPPGGRYYMLHESSLFVEDTVLRLRRSDLIDRRSAFGSNGIGEGVRSILR